MHIFKISPEASEKIRRETRKKTIPLILIAMAAGLAIPMVNATNGFDVTSTVVSLSVMVFILFFSLKRTFKRQEILLESYRFIISDNLVKRQQLNTPTISLYTNEITAITQNGKGGIQITSSDRANTIYIPAHIDNYDLLLEMLLAIHPVEKQENVSLLKRYPLITALVILVPMFLVYTVQNKIVVAVSGVVVVAFLVRSLVILQTNKNVESRGKRNSWVSLLVIISIIVVVIMKLMQP